MNYKKPRKPTNRFMAEIRALDYMKQDNPPGFNSARKIQAISIKLDDFELLGCDKAIATDIKKVHTHQYIDLIVTPLQFAGNVADMLAAATSGDLEIPVNIHARYVLAETAPKRVENYETFLSVLSCKFWIDWFDKQGIK